jgi:hypothetical protein
MITTREFFEHDAEHEIALVQNSEKSKYQVKQTMTLDEWLKTE